MWHLRKFCCESYLLEWHSQESFTCVYVIVSIWLELIAFHSAVFVDKKPYCDNEIAGWTFLTVDRFLHRDCCGWFPGNYSPVVFLLTSLHAMTQSLTIVCMLWIKFWGSLQGQGLVRAQLRQAVKLLSNFMEFVTAQSAERSLIYHWIGFLLKFRRYQPHCRSGLVTVPSVGAVP